eukprot:1297025-Amphidinium_carterae.2
MILARAQQSVWCPEVLVLANKQDMPTSLKEDRPCCMLSVLNRTMSLETPHSRGIKGVSLSMLPTSQTLPCRIVSPPDY